MVPAQPRDHQQIACLLWAPCFISPSSLNSWKALPLLSQNLCVRAPIHRRLHLWEEGMSPQEEQDSHGVSDAESGRELAETDSQRPEHMPRPTLYLGLERGEARTALQACPGPARQHP